MYTIKSKIIRSPHGFSTRLGGVSTASHTASLNLAFDRGDSDEIVLENLSLLCNSLGTDPENTVSHPQIHSSKIIKVTEQNRGEGYYKRENIAPCDGYITDRPHVVLGVKSADCVPILMECEKDGNIMCVGGVHAGWRGTVDGIAPACVEKMRAEYGATPENIRVAIGPCIHACCYEVDEDFVLAVREKLGDSLACRHIRKRVNKANKYECDLVGLNKELLLMSGVKEESIDVIDYCTCCNPHLFYSHRYTGGVRGTMLSVIFMSEENNG